MENKFYNCSINRLNRFERFEQTTRTFSHSMTKRTLAGATSSSRLINKGMVEENTNLGIKPVKSKAARPKPVYLWSVVDVQKWLRRHCSDYCNLYSENFLQHEITGRTLIRINENNLLRIGIDNSVHRTDIWREIIKLRLKTDIMEIRDLERQNTAIYFD